LSFLKKENLKPKEVWVGSGGTLLMYGLREYTSDIDIDLNKVLFDKFKKRKLPTHIFNGDTLVIEYDDFIDLHERKVKDFTLIEGVGSWTLEEVLALKQRLNRPKDQEDIKNIKEYLNKSKSSKIKDWV
jgi:hypothetical protein